MCGRYALSGPSSRYQFHFGIQAGFDFAPHFNAAPSQFLPVVRRLADGSRACSLAQWGLIPSWVRDPADIGHPINAKAETVAIKPMFRHAFRKSRVLVPADAFYEWKPVAGGKQPYAIRLRDGSPMGLAGLLEHWNAPSGEALLTFTVLTTTANSLMRPIHDRMPAIIRPEDYALWLDPDFGDVGRLQSMLGPYPERLMEAHPVSKRVNSPANDDPDLLEALPLP